MECERAERKLFEVQVKKVQNDLKEKLKKGEFSREEIKNIEKDIKEYFKSDIRSDYFMSQGLDVRKVMM